MTFALVLFYIKKPKRRSTTINVSVMRVRGLEPPRAYAHQNLNLTCLPIPPYPRIGRNNDGAIVSQSASLPRADFTIFHNF